MTKDIPCQSSSWLSLDLLGDPRCARYSVRSSRDRCRSPAGVLALTRLLVGCALLGPSLRQAEGHTSFDQVSFLLQPFCKRRGIRELFVEP